MCTAAPTPRRAAAAVDGGGADAGGGGVVAVKEDGFAIEERTEESEAAELLELVTNFAETTMCHASAPATSEKNHS